MLSKTTIVFFAFIATTSSARYHIQAPKLDDSSGLIIEAMVDILASCYGNEKLGIGLYGDIPQTFLETLWSRKFVPILLLHDYSCFSFENRLYQQKLNIFVIIATDLRKFIYIFQEIGCSGRFSNRRASFLIVEWSSRREYGCHYNRSGEMIRAAWDHKVVNVNVLCLNATNGRIIYTYNPFTDQAPAPWEHIETLDKSPSYANLSFFQREYQQNGSCKSLYFDKLKDIGGSPIPYVRITTGWNGPTNGNKYRRLMVLDDEFLNVAQTFARQLHGTLKRTVVRSSKDFLFLPTNMHQNLNSFDYVSVMTYPYKQMDILIVTHFHGYKSQLSKILNIVDSFSQLSVCSVLLITWIFLKFFTHQAVIPASLNVFRIICNTGLVNLSEDTASRFYRVGLYFFMVTIHGIFAGNLASLLTSNIPIEHPQSIRNLVDGNYTIYHATYYDFLFEEVQGPIHEVFLSYFGDVCLENIVDKDPLTACVAPAQEVLDFVTGNKFYVTKTPIIKLYRAYHTGPHWMFVEKFDRVHSRMVAADIVDTLDMRVSKEILNRENSIEGPRIMNLNDLYFAFIILGIGLSCALLCFIVEMTIGRNCFFIGKNWRNPLNCFRRKKAKIQNITVKPIEY